MMSDQSVEFLPFHAINEFMRDDYRMQIIQDVYGNEQLLEEEMRSRLEKMTRLTLKVPGFRNSAKAPVRLKTKSAEDVFERNPFFVAEILECWCALHVELQQKVYALITGRGWEVLPVEADRTQLPGFLMTWPSGETFENMVAAYQEVNSGGSESADDISLMVVWLSGRLPYDTDDVQPEPE